MIMKKIFTFAFIILLSTSQAFALNFGMYKPEEDYGLVDGFKLNFGKNKNPEAGLFQIKSEIPGEKERMEKEKAKYEADKDKKDDDEYQMFKFMLDDTVAF